MASIPVAMVQADDTEAKTLGPIIVTGARIRRNQLDAASPIQIVSLASGVPGVADLNTIPGSSSMTRLLSEARR